MSKPFGPPERPLNNGFRTVEGGDGNGHVGEFVYATPTYFETMGIPVLAGRALSRFRYSRADARGSGERESSAKKYFHGDALGRHLRGGKEISEIVGICGDVQQHSGLNGDNGPLSMEPTVYLPASQLSDDFVKLIHTWFSPKWVVRTQRSHVQPDRADPGSRIRGGPTAADRALPNDRRTARALYRQPEVPGRAVFDTGRPGAATGVDRPVWTDFAIHHAAQA